MLEFKLKGAGDPTVAVLLHQIVGVAQDGRGTVVLYTAGGESFILGETYAEARGKLRNATGPRPPGS